MGRQRVLLSELETRSPASFLADSILCFLPAVEMKPRTLWACHSVAFMISASVAPAGRAIRSRIFAPLLSARGFFSTLAVLLAGVAPLAFFSRVGAPFFGVAPFFEEAFSRAPCAPVLAAVTAAAPGAPCGSWFVISVSVPFCAVLAHDDSSLGLCEKARKSWRV